MKEHDPLGDLVPLTREEWRRVGDLVIELHDTLKDDEDSRCELDQVEAVLWELDCHVNRVENRLAGVEDLAP